MFLRSIPLIISHDAIIRWACQLNARPKGHILINSLIKRRRVEYRQNGRLGRPAGRGSQLTPLGYTL